MMWTAPTLLSTSAPRTGWIRTSWSIGVRPSEQFHAFRKASESARGPSELSIAGGSGQVRIRAPMIEAAKRSILGALDASRMRDLPAAPWRRGPRPGARRMGVSFLGSGLIQLLGVVTGILLARGLGPTDRGAFAAMLLWPTVM